MKTLVIYLDKTFSFKIGHYVNMLLNMRDTFNTEELLVLHDTWEYFDKTDNIFFEENDINHKLIKFDFETFKTYFSDELFKKYDKIVVYAYKGDINLINLMCDIRNVFPSLFHGIFITLFVYPHHSISSNGFMDESFDKILVNALENAKNSDIRILTDMLYVFDAYPLIEYRPPPIILYNAEQKLIQKEKFNIFMPVFSFTNSADRYESTIFILNVIKFLCDSNKVNKLVVKVYDKSNISSEILKNSKIQIAYQLSNDEYIRHIKECDIIYLPYSPIYYKYRSSMMFIEAIINNKIIITTNDTYISRIYCDEMLTYNFNDFNKLKKSFLYAFSIMQARFSNNTKKYIEEWNYEIFRKMILL